MNQCVPLSTEKTATFIVGDKGEEVLNFRQWYKKNNLTSAIIEVESWEVIARLVQSGLGVGLLPDYILRNSQNKNMYEIKSDLVLPSFELKLFFRSAKTLPRNCKIFQDFLLN